MKLRPLVLGSAGLLLLALAAALVPGPRRPPRPDLQGIAPFSAGERIALVIPEPESFPPADSFGLVQRARAAGAEVRIFAPGGPIREFAPTRIYQPFPGPSTPTGYHPDQWPTLPPDGKDSGQDWRLLVLTPAEIALKSQAVLAAAHALRDSGSDDSQGTREAALLSRARRAELFLPLHP